MSRIRLHEIYAILLRMKGQDTMKRRAEHTSSYSSGFEAGDCPFIRNRMAALQIFASGPFKALARML
jgi:hypothetical protein